MFTICAYSALSFFIIIRYTHDEKVPQYPSIENQMLSCETNHASAMCGLCGNMEENNVHLYWRSMPCMQ